MLHGSHYCDGAGGILHKKRVLDWARRRSDCKDFVGMALRFERQKGDGRRSERNPKSSIDILEHVSAGVHVDDSSTIRTAEPSPDRDAPTRGRLPEMNTVRPRKAKPV